MFFNKTLKKYFIEKGDQVEIVKNPFSDSDPTGICSGCRARDAHIEDLRQLLMLEKEQRDLLIGRVLGINQAPTQESTSETGSPVIRPGYTSLSERRRQAAMRETEGTGASPSQHTQDFWTRRKQNMLEEEKLLHERIAEAAARRAQEQEVKETKQPENPHHHTVPAFVEGSAAVDPVDTSERAEVRAVLD